MPCRKWKYDEAIPEFFVQTSDVVRVKKSELDRWIQASQGEEAWTCLIFFWCDLDHSIFDQGETVPKNVDHLALMDTSASSGSNGNGNPENPGAIGATPLDDWDEIKENLKAFTDSVHAKASQVVSWIQQAEPLQTESSIRLLDPKLSKNI